MERAYAGLLFGLLGAVGLIYLLIDVNFQSWIDPAVIVSALPAALAGIEWMLFARTRRCRCPRSRAPSCACAWAWPPPTASS